MKKSILALLAVAATGSVMAEAQPYATIINAEGLSTVSVGNQMMNATNGMKLVQGAQLLTTAKSAITVDFAGGCTAVLKAGQSMNVNLADCKTLVAGKAPAKLNAGSGVAAGGITESLAASLGVSATTGIIAAVAVTAGAVAIVDKDPRYTKVRNANGTFTVTDTDTGNKAILSADGKTVSPISGS